MTNRAALALHVSVAGTCLLNLGLSLLVYDIVSIEIASSAEQAGVVYRRLVRVGRYSGTSMKDRT